MSTQIFRADGTRVMRGKRLVVAETRSGLDAENIATALNIYGDAVAALEPFCEAAKRADEHKAMSERLGMGTVGDDASTGLGITFRHLYAAREVVTKARGEA